MKAKTIKQSRSLRKTIGDFKKGLSVLYKDRLKQVILFGSWARAEGTEGRNTGLKEIQSLLKRARKYLKNAGTLITEKDYESSVSRSYYAMFYSAEAVLLSKGLSFSSHKGVLSAFGEHPVFIFPSETIVGLSAICTEECH